MKILMILSLLFFVPGNQVAHASCSSAYEHKVASIQKNEVVIRNIAWPIGVAVGFGVATLVTYDYVLFMPLGGAAGFFTAEEIAKIRERKFTHMDMVIKDSNHAEYTEDLRIESEVLSKSMKKTLSAEDVASAVAKLDASDLFCPGGKPARLHAFRKLIQRELETQD